MDDNKRRHVRLKMESRVTIEVEAQNAATGEPAREVPCTVIDVSWGGFSVAVDEELIEGAVLPVVVKLPTVEDPFRLVGEVAWCRAAANDDEGPGWRAGFALYFSSDSDIAEWRELLEHV